jgi:hypothetical protein
VFGQLFDAYLSNWYETKDELGSASFLYASLVSYTILTSGVCDKVYMLHGGMVVVVCSLHV